VGLIGFGVGFAKGLGPYPKRVLNVKRGQGGLKMGVLADVLDASS
jgi:hypothetical protein